MPSFGALDVLSPRAHIDGMQSLPVTIKKHPIGYVFIALVGLGATAIVWALMFSLWRSGDLDEITYWMLGFASILSLIITMVQLYVYSLSYILLTDDGLKVKNWRTLFVSQDAEAGWKRVQDVSWTTGSIWSLLFNYGALEVQTAGTKQRLVMTMVPNAEYWQAVMTSHSLAAMEFSAGDSF